MIETIFETMGMLYGYFVGGILAFKLLQYLLSSCKVDLFIIKEYKRQYKQAMDDLKRG